MLGFHWLYTEPAWWPNGRSFGKLKVFKSKVKRITFKVSKFSLWILYKKTLISGEENILGRRLAATATVTLNSWKRNEDLILFFLYFQFQYGTQLWFSTYLWRGKFQQSSDWKFSRLTGSWKNREQW